MKVKGPDGKIIQFPDDTPPDTIRVAMARRYGGPSAPMAMTDQYNPISSYISGQSAAMRDMGVRALPTLGGFAGGIAGTPGGLPGMIAGAVAGGAAGEGLRQRAMGEQFSPERIASEGGLQGLYELGGGVATRTAAKIAKPIMRQAVGAIPSLAKRFRTTPEAISEILLRLRLPVSVSGRQSAEKIGTAARVARSDVFSRVPSTFGAPTLSRIVLSDAQRAVGRPLTRAERSQLINMVQAEADAILAGRTHGVIPKTIPPTPAQPASQILNQFGKPAIPAAPMGPRVPSRYTARELEQIKEVSARKARPAFVREQEALGLAASPEFNKQIASGARRQLGAIPGVTGYNQQIRDAMIAEQAISRSLTRPGEWTPIHVGPVSLGFKVPQNKVSGAALLLTSDRFRRLARQSPRALAEIYRQLIYRAEPDATLQSP